MTDLITRLKEAHERALPTPWFATHSSNDIDCMDLDREVWTVGPNQHDENWTTDCGHAGYGILKADAELIALMRNNIHTLIDIVKAATELKRVHSKIPVNMYGDYSKRQEMIDAMGSLFLQLAKLES